MSDRSEQILESDVARTMLDAIKEFRELVAGPPAPDAEVRAWQLYLSPFGGIYCGRDECGCVAENSEIVSCDHYVDCDDPAANLVTLAEIHAAIGEHIAHRAQVKAEEAEIGGAS